MTIFTNKNTKILFLMIFLVLLLSAIAGQLFSFTLADDYKQSMFSHDYEVAGYLKQANVDSDIIQKAFTASKNRESSNVGEKLLTSAGYNKNISEQLLSNVSHLHYKYAFLLLLMSLFTAALILAFLLHYFLQQEKTLKKAAATITEFINGNTEVRLEQHEEGSLSKLFTCINGLATSLNSHIIKEKQNKEFLKVTISDISHQLKTPLAALRMYNEILQEEKTDNEVVTDFLHKTDRELTRMETLILNLLKLAKLDSDAILLNRKTGYLKGFLEELARDFRTRAAKENKLLSLECDDQLTLSYDIEWLHEALSNIVKNAFDHTKEQDRIEIICRDTPVLKEILIKDTGSGIHPEDIHFIFKRFYRSRFSKDTQGTGIGLTMAKMIVEKHDGSISVTSELGKGTTFCLAFPKLTNM